MKLIALFYLLLCATAWAETPAPVSSPVPDPVNDVDHNIRGFCPNFETDIVTTEFSKSSSEIVVKIKISEPIHEKLAYGYREYYFWIGNPLNRSGYQPYEPYSVAWPDLYADYRVFFSLNQGHRRVAVQDCLLNDCARDNGLNPAPELHVTIEDDTVVFRFPPKLLPRIQNLDQVKLGYTTYYSLEGCSGEDDSPDWGKKALIK